MNRDEQTTGVIRPRYPLARLSPAKTDVRVLTIPRGCVLDPDPGPVLQELEGMSATAALAERWEGRVTFVFAGWTHDPRITAEIPEIRDYFAALTEAWPYWLYFGEKVGDTLPYVLRLLCRGQVERFAQGGIGWRFDDLDEVRRQLLRLFLGMDALRNRLGLPAAMYERISQEVAQLLEQAFSGVERQ